MTLSQVKVCGITTIGDAEDCINAQADFLGFIFYKNSKRYISFDNSKKITEKVNDKIKTVAVTVDPSDEDIFRINETRFSHIQLHGNESVERVTEIKSFTNCKIIKAFGVNDLDDLQNINDYSDLVDMFLLDAKPQISEQPGGNARSFDWSILKDFKPNKEYFLSGGLNPENIEKAIKTVKTIFFDISSGVEKEPGLKDKEKVTRFIKLSKDYD